MQSKKNSMMSTTADTSVAQLMDDLKNEDVGVRVEAVFHLHTIALALGPERARSELLPFCENSLLEEEDEVLCAVAAQLNHSFIDLIGGSTYISFLCPLWENLLGSEETNVRTECLSALSTIFAPPASSPSSPPNHPPDIVKSAFVPIFERLSGKTEWFTKKSSAAYIAPLLINYLDCEQCVKVREIFKTSLLSDDNPIVRRAALTACKSIFKAKLADDSWTEWLRTVEPLIDDSQDSVRLLVVEPIALIGQHLSHDLQICIVFPLVMRLIGDQSWRVRYMAALSYTELMRGIGLTAPEFDPIIAFSGLLSDYEAEVRIAAAGQVAKVAALWPTTETFANGLLPVLQRITVDQNAAVRAALALQLNDLSAIAGRESTMADLLPLFLQLFQDDSSQVRLNVISKLDTINQVIGVEHLSQALLPAIIKLTEDRLWTVRQAIIEYIPVVSEHLGVRFYDSQLLDISLGLLDDPVYAVRQAAIEMLRKLGTLFGAQHFAESILPGLAKYSSHLNYLRRITFLMAMAQCRETLALVDPALYVPAIDRLASDPIANVRINVAKTARQLSLQNLDTVIDQLKNDTDEDVRFFATNY